MACTEQEPASILPAQITAPEIREHNILTNDQRKLARTFRKLSQQRGEQLTWIQFAEIMIRGSARNYTIAMDEAGDEVTTERVVSDHELRRNAILYTYEALRACDVDIIRQWPEFDEMLRCLETLADNLP